MSGRKDSDQAGYLWVETGEDKVLPLVTVAPVAPVDKTYTFAASEEMVSQIRLGRRVMVPFGKRGTLKPAVVTSIDRGTWNSTLKNVDSVLDSAGELSPHLIELGQWMAGYYCCPLGRTLAAMAPAAVRRQSGFVTVRRARLVRPLEEVELPRLGAKQKAVLEYLSAAGEEVDVRVMLEEVGSSRATLKGLIDKGLVEESVSKEAPEAKDEGWPVVEPEFEPNESQQKALDRIRSVIDDNVFRALLLFGVSGSGKTEVYIRAMRHVLAAGKQAIMLVPEIALTTQLMRRLAERFEKVAVIHSGLTDSQRGVAWDGIASGRTPVVIGTRSAVFAPCPDLGLIVIDEEQESSYKNLQSPRFGVRDVAVKRAHMLGIPVILGSATPSLETWHNVQRYEHYERIDLPVRVRSLPLPSVRLVPMKMDRRDDGGMPTIASSLREELRETLERKEQAVLLLNRRGFASGLYCPQCDYRVRCDNCKVSMVLHQSRNEVVCHHCSARRPVPVVCADPSCGAKLVRGGTGTERVEDELRLAFPGVRIARADSDTMTHGDKYQALISGFEKREIDVLLGTQMIAKGLDFPNVSLVGVIGADATTAMADFRVNERLFQLVTQVAGRAGRADVPGRVVVQTQSPDLLALQCAVDHDFERFAVSEMRDRQILGFPPFARLTRFVVSGKRERDVNEQAGGLVGRLGKAIEGAGVRGIDVLGPQPCVIERIRQQYRYEVLLRAVAGKVMQQVLDIARTSGILRVRGASMMVDVDPLSLT